MNVFIWSAIFIGSLGVLVKASDYFTKASEKIGKFIGIPSFITGVTIVAIGTSLPELVSSIIAVLKNSSEIVIGNVLGSNITNIFLILGLVGIVGRKIKISFELIHVDLPFLAGSAFFILVALLDGKFSFLEALLSVIAISIYLFYTISTVKKKEKNSQSKKEKINLSTFLILLVSGFFVYLGAKYTIESVIKLSEILNIAKEVIVASFVALGTSLPELTVSLVAAKKGNSEIAVGNILGSNIFNSFGVMGISGIVGTLLSTKIVLNFLLPISTLATLLYFFITQDKEITKWEGMLLLIFYIFYFVRLFN